MTRHVAVVDIGKSNTKLALVDTATAEEMRVVKQPSEVDSHGLYPSLDHHSMQAFIEQSLADWARDTQIDAITVTTHGATAALIDADGQLVLPVLDYEYLAVDDLRLDYEQHRPAFSETGSPALPGGLNIGAQLFWQQTRFPELFSSVDAVLTWPQYWVHWLSGARHNDVTSLGCHTDLYEPPQHRYSTLIDRQSWKHIMPPVRPSGTACGTLTAELAARLGLSPTLPVHTGIHDSNASLVPHLMAQEPPFTVVSSGTWCIVMAVGGQAVSLDEARDTLLNVNAFGDSVPSARFMGGREHELLSASVTVCDADLDGLLEYREAPPMLMPSTVEGTGPYPDSQARWTSIPDSPQQRECALSLYLAMMTYECMRLVGSCGPVFVEGPLAHDAVYAQMLLAVSDQPVLISHADTGTSIGAAMLVSAPEHFPDYRPTKTTSSRKAELRRYADRWQACLRDHGR